MGAAQQIFPLGGSSPGVLPVTSDLYGAYSVLKLTNTATKSLRVRRSSDNAEQDIGFVGQYLDTVSMLTFVGANNGFVTIWYDQSSHGVDLTQATAASQPQIVYAGIYLGWMCLDGVDDFFTTAVNTAVNANAFCVYFGGRLRRSQNTDPTLQQGSLWYKHSISFTSVNNDCDVNIGSNLQSFNTFTDGNGSSNTPSIYYPVFGLANNGVMTMVHDLTGATTLAQCQRYLNGVADTSWLFNNGLLDSGVFPQGTLSIGKQSGGTCARLALQTILWYQPSTGGHSAGTVSTVQASIPAYNGTPSTTNNLDSYLTSCSGMYALVKLRSAYAGSCLRVRRSSDNTEQDVGFTAAGIIDSAAMLTFVGANNGFVTKWYDQSAAANDFVQATQANQPQIVSSGVYLGYLQFDGTNDILSQTSNSGTFSAATAYVKAALRNAPVAFVEVLGHQNGATKDCTFGWTGANKAFAGGITGSPNQAVSDYYVQFIGQVFAMNFVYGAASFAAAAQGYDGGFAPTRFANSDTGVPPTGTAGAYKWNIGGRPDGTVPSQSNYYAVVLYEANHSAATVDLISGIIG